MSFDDPCPDRVLDELGQRLAHTRWSYQIAGTHWDAGTDVDYLRQLVTYWHDAYDWRAHEAALNRFAQFRDPARRHRHPLHPRARQGGRAVPADPHPRLSRFVLPVREADPDVTDPAAFGGDPDDWFDVVVPNLPGFAFSDPPTEHVAVFRVHDLCAQLMDELGYSRFAAHGGDWGIAR